MRAAVTVLGPMASPMNRITFLAGLAMSTLDLPRAVCIATLGMDGVVATKAQAH